MFWLGLDALLPYPDDGVTELGFAAEEAGLGSAVVLELPK